MLNLDYLRNLDIFAPKITTYIHLSPNSVLGLAPCIVLEVLRGEVDFFKAGIQQLTPVDQGTGT